MATFIGDHIGTIVQFALTAWMAKIARDFQVTISVYGTRLETTREAVRRGRVLWWLKKTDPGWTDIMNEMMDWHATNEVFLTPAAARAFLDVHLLKSLQGTMPDRTDLREHFQNADRGLKRLSVELLRFRKRPLGDLVWDWVTGLFRKPPPEPRVGVIPPP